MTGALENNAELDGSFPITTNLFNKNAIKCVCEWLFF